MEKYKKNLLIFIVLITTLSCKEESKFKSNAKVFKAEKKQEVAYNKKISKSKPAKGRSD